MTSTQLDYQLLMYRLWLDTNPPISEIAKRSAEELEAIRNNKH